MAYSFQTFAFGEVLASSKMNQVEINIRDHVHGQDGVASIPSSGVTGLGSLAGLNVAQIANGGTGATVVSSAQAALGLEIGVDVQAYNAQIPFRDVASAWSQQQWFNTGNLTDTTTIAWNLNSNQVATVTLGGNRSLANPTNMKNGGTYHLLVKQDATGGRTLSFGSAYKWRNGLAPTLSTGANAVDLLSFISDGSNMYGVATKGFA